jgi:hypothetical protein
MREEHPRVRPPPGQPADHDLLVRHLPLDPHVKVGEGAPEARHPVRIARHTERFTIEDHVRRHELWHVVDVAATPDLVIEPAVEARVSIG